MNLKNSLLSKIARYNRVHSVSSHLYQFLEKADLIYDKKKSKQGLLPGKGQVEYRIRKDQWKLCQMLDVFYSFISIEVTQAYTHMCNFIQLYTEDYSSLCILCILYPNTFLSSQVILILHLSSLPLLFLSLLLWSSTLPLGFQSNYLSLRPIFSLCLFCSIAGAFSPFSSAQANLIEYSSRYVPIHNYQLQDSVFLPSSLFHDLGLSML